MAAPKGHPPYNVNGEGGAPRIHDEALADKLSYELEEWMKNPENIWLKDFCLERGYDSSYISVWEKRSERFNKVYKQAKEWQESKLTKGSVMNRFNQRMTAMILANHHGWTEKPVQVVFQDNGLNQFKEKLNKEKNPLLKKKDK